MNILAVGCHPDDLEIGCGGTLARCASRGDRVTMCVCANGNLGHAILMPDELRRVRAAEVQAAASVLGVSEAVMLDANDLEVDSRNPQLTNKLVNLIRRVQPDMIIAHSPDDYMRDHVEASKLVFDASFTASIPHYDTETPGVAEIVPIYYMDNLAGVNFLPTEYVDVSATVEQKLSALDCHESQVKWMRDHDGIDFLDFVRTTAKFRGLQCGCAYAEGFRLCPAWPRLPARRLLPE